MKTECVFALVCVTVCYGCLPNEQLRKDEVRQYLDSHPDTPKRILVDAALSGSGDNLAVDMRRLVALEGVGARWCETSGCPELVAKSAGIVDTSDASVLRACKRLCAGLRKPDMHDDEKERLVASFAVDVIALRDPGLLRQIERCFFEGRVVLGMSQDDVLFIKGRPHSTHKSFSAGLGRLSFWTYNKYRGSTTVTFRDGIVTDISTFDY